MKINDIITYESIQYRIWFIDEENQVIHLKENNNEDNGICIEFALNLQILNNQ